MEKNKKIISAIIIIIFIGTLTFLFNRGTNKKEGISLSSTYSPETSKILKSTTTNDTDWPRTFYVISESLVAKKLNGSEEKIYNYGDKLVTNSNLEILDGGRRTSLFIENKKDLVMDSLFSIYTEIFPLKVDAYKKLPIEIKYKILTKSGIFCNFSNISSIDSITELLTGSIPNDQGIISTDISKISSCAIKFAMPKSPFAAEHSVAYANIDDNLKTPDHIIVVMENIQYSNSSDCAGNATIFSIDAEGKYFDKDLGNIYSVCYIDTIKKGTTVQITKKIDNPDPGGSKEINEDLVIPADSFVINTANNGPVYLLYDRTTSTQVKTIFSKPNYYSYGE